jgi:hypothetical protein
VDVGLNSAVPIATGYSGNDKAQINERADYARETSFEQASVGTTNVFESQNVRRPLLVVDGRSHQLWSYSSCRRIQSWGPSPSSRPFGARSRIP